ncbi:GntR family transcriptional regulator [Staphylococcus pseudintermedius]|nr:GntR family transcriptional regulator [Staphylococcus pseudintermedius]
MEIPKQWLTYLSKGEAIAATLRLSIMSGERATHKLLTENQVANEFQVSRSPVRDAFKILAQERLIRLERMGAEIIPFTDKQRQELTDIRLMIESFAFTKVIQRSDWMEIVQSMQQALAMMQVNIQYKDAASFAENDLKFHELMVLACDHHYLTHLWQQIMPTMLCLNYMSMKKRMDENFEDFERVIQNHELFVSAIAQKDRKMMYEAFEANFNDLNNDIGAFWAQ